MLLSHVVWCAAVLSQSFALPSVRFPSSERRGDNQTAKCGTNAECLAAHMPLLPPNARRSIIEKRDVITYRSTYTRYRYGPTTVAGDYVFTVIGANGGYSGTSGNQGLGAYINTTLHIPADATLVIQSAQSGSGSLNGGGGGGGASAVNLLLNGATGAGVPLIIAGGGGGAGPNGAGGNAGTDLTVTLTNADGGAGGSGPGGGGGGGYYSDGGSGDNFAEGGPSYVNGAGGAYGGPGGGNANFGSGGGGETGGGGGGGSFGGTGGSSSTVSLGGTGGGSYLTGDATYNARMTTVMVRTLSATDGDMGSVIMYTP